MAINAEFCFRRFKFKNLFARGSMAVRAFGEDVAAGQGEAGFAMIKAFAAFKCVPGIRGVADRTLLLQQVFAEDTNMDVLMTSFAGLLH